MIDPDALVADLNKQVLALEADLRERITLPTFDDPWQAEHAAAQAGDRTAATYTAWADDRITQAAVAWVLTTVFIRFCEDNRLLNPMWISGPPERRQEALDAQLAYFRAHPEHTDREWVEQAIAHLATTPATAGLVDDQAMLHTVSPSGQAVTKLLEFWRRPRRHRRTHARLHRRRSGHPVPRRPLPGPLRARQEDATPCCRPPSSSRSSSSTAPSRRPSTSSATRRGFSSSTPPAAPATSCSAPSSAPRQPGTRGEPGRTMREPRPARPGRQVHGVDLNPFAVAIARFRLTVAALQACGVRARLEDAPGFRITRAPSATPCWFTARDQDALVRASGDGLRLLHRGQATSTAAASCTPAGTTWSSATRPTSRSRTRPSTRPTASWYNDLQGQVRADRAVHGAVLRARQARNGRSQPAGSGRSPSNSFMKREFGSKLIEDFLSQPRPPSDRHIRAPTSPATAPRR